MRTRRYPESNYISCFTDSYKTVRFKFDKSKDFVATPTPEIEDVAINSRCLANCSYCYTSANPDGKDFTDICDKAQNVWGSLKESERPFQIAIGGAGESTMHPDWIDFVKTVKDLNILPNYTTNGMHLSKSILKATEDACGGVALSWHPHIPQVFHNAYKRLSSIQTKLNFHVIVGAEQSLEDLKMLYDKYRDGVEYFVILPYQEAGRGKKINNIKDVWTECFNWIKGLNDDKFAFGALFYEWMKENGTNGIDISMYEPEIFSGYRMMDENYKTLYKSSYDLTPKGNTYVQINICH